MNLPPTGKSEVTRKATFSVYIWLVLAIMAAIGGMAFFIFLFIPDFNVYSLIISPIIIAFYEAPAVFFYWIYKKKRKVLLSQEEVPPLQ